MIGILGKKIGMTRIFDDSGNAVAVTIIECQANKVMRVKTQEKDGYSAVVLGTAPMNKPRKTKSMYCVKEFKVEEIQHKQDDKVDLSAFAEAAKVKVTAKSKGKGFQGGIKRHNFARGPETHGSHHHREIGSIGACAKPGRVHKGKKMPGRMGHGQITLRKVKVISVDPKNNTIALKGAIPGPNGGFIRIELEQ